MKPSVTVAWGGGLHLHGSPAGTRSVAMDTTNSPGIGAGQNNNVFNEWDAGGVGSFNDYWKAAYGGELSLCPNGLSNHKPGAFYFGEFYFQKNIVSLQQSQVYLLRFDGSGQFLQARNGQSFNNKSHSGRGVDFLSPSGTHTVYCHPLAHIVHNGVMFMCGAFMRHDENPLISNWKTKENWNIKDQNLTTTGTDSGEYLPRRRAYGVFTIHKKTRKGKEFRDAAGNLARFNSGLTGIAPDSECLGACDAISWNDSIIYANHADVIEFPGGSGRARFIEANDVELSAKCFASYPTSGFDSSNNPVGSEDLMMLTSSGVLKRVLFPGDPLHNPSGSVNIDIETHASGRPLGLESMVNLASLVGGKVRTDGQMARTFGTTEEPTRSCLLKSFNNRLHAFFISATSGYYHFVCDGNPRSLNNWIDRTSFLPDEFKLWDGDMFGYVDDIKNRISCMHISKSNIGLYGVTAGNKGAGGWTVSELTQDNVWINKSHGGANAPGVGFIPYDSNGVFVEAPSGIFTNNPEVIPSTDYALLRYQLFTGRNPGLRADVDIEYTTDNGTTWNEASRFDDYSTGTPLGEGKTGLTASVDGDTHEFYWAHVKDVGFNPNKNARLRVKPKNVRGL